MSSSEDYSKVVLREGGYTVIFANDGTIMKPDPRLKTLSKGSLPTHCLEPGCTNTQLSTKGYCKDHGKHKRDWVAKLDATPRPPSHGFYVNLMLEWSGIKNGSLRGHSFAYCPGSRSCSSKLSTLDVFMQELMDTIVGNLPDASTLQDNLMASGQGNLQARTKLTPDEIVVVVNELVDKHFPSAQYQNENIDAMYAKRNLPKIPIRIAAALLATAFVCEEVNRGDLHHRRNNGGEADMCGATMAFARYVLARHTNMPETMIKKALK